MSAVTNAARKRMKNWMPLAILPVIATVCLLMWLLMSGSYEAVWPDSGVWDLRGFDLAGESVRVMGDVEYIEGALLTPEQFEARADEIQIGNPNDCDYATSRVTLLLPDGVYQLAGNSTDYANRYFVNGDWVLDVGVPGDSKGSAVPNTASVSFTVKPVDGAVQIVQQVSNFVHKEGGGHTGFLIGLPGMVAPMYPLDVTHIELGCYLALFSVHLALFFLLRSYTVNLHFSLFCLTWFLRAGVIGPKVFSTILPWLNWYVKFRIEYISLPVAGILVVLMLNRQFPNVLPLWFRRAVCLSLGAFIALFLVADTVFMSWALLVCYAVLALGILGVTLFFLLRFRRPNMEQVVCLSGVALLFYAGIRDMFYYNDILLFPFVGADLTQVAMLIFVFFQMTAVFMGTMREVELAKDAERKLAAENAALDRLSRMKGELLSTMSHETRTPLAVLSGYAELVAMELNRKGVDEQAGRDLKEIANEAQRLAGLMEQIQNVSRERETARREYWLDIGDILRQTARLYEPILERRNTRLTLDVPERLPRIYGNPDELTQVLFNLLSNARNHTENGEVAITAREEGGQVTVTVEDTGEGIRAAFLPRAFERGAHDDPRGSGLGLAICKEIIDAHGGLIEIESELQRGTRVRFGLPADGGGDAGE